MERRQDKKLLNSTHDEEENNDQHLLDRKESKLKDVKETKQRKSRKRIELEESKEDNEFLESNPIEIEKLEETKNSTSIENENHKTQEFALTSAHSSSLSSSSSSFSSLDATSLAKVLSFFIDNNDKNEKWKCQMATEFSQTFLQICATLAEFKSSIKFHFTDQGLKVYCQDNSEHAYLSLSLQKMFYFYECPKYFSTTIELEDTNKLFKRMKSDTILLNLSFSNLKFQLYFQNKVAVASEYTLNASKDDENHTKGQKKFFEEMSLMDELQSNFQIGISLSSQTFAKICKQSETANHHYLTLLVNADRVTFQSTTKSPRTKGKQDGEEIETNKTERTLFSPSESMQEKKEKSKGNFLKAPLVFQNQDQQIQKQNGENSESKKKKEKKQQFLFRGSFSLKHLVSFTKDRPSTTLNVYIRKQETSSSKQGLNTAIFEYPLTENVLLRSGKQKRETETRNKEKRKEGVEESSEKNVAQDSFRMLLPVILDATIQIEENEFNGVKKKGKSVSENSKNKLQNKTKTGKRKAKPNKKDSRNEIVQEKKKKEKNLRVKKEAVKNRIAIILLFVFLFV